MYGKICTKKDEKKSRPLPVDKVAQEIKTIYICRAVALPCAFVIQMRPQQTLKICRGISLFSVYQILLIRMGDLRSPAGEHSSPLPCVRSTYLQEGALRGIFCSLFTSIYDWLQLVFRNVKEKLFRPLGR